ncbi:hypothetical protein AMTR_s00014p00257850 [Amborella trichopoda]|uniref:Uncharacterized protein n=1 Tax=Amborella trichopoda TaxID=13333 RepID=W1PNE4_AMBTC|nr:hypothetical protein AMTR_s00014p00257850 [Amborella trichopoda]
MEPHNAPTVHKHAIQVNASAVQTSRSGSQASAATGGSDSTHVRSSDPPSRSGTTSLPLQQSSFWSMALRQSICSLWRSTFTIRHYDLLALAFKLLEPQ